MRACYLTDKKRFTIRDIPELDCPSDGVLLEVKACGVCGSDIRRFLEGPADKTDIMIPGHEVAGVVCTVGKDVQSYSVGDRLAIAPDVHCGKCWYCKRGKYNLCDDIRLVGITPSLAGGFAEKILLSTDVIERGIVHRIPEGMSFTNATLSEPTSSVIASHEKANTSLGETVVIIGTGPIGCIHISVAKARGAKVIVSEPNKKRLKIAESFNPDLIINPAKEDFIDQVREATNGLGADVIICANPVPATQSEAVYAVRKGGRIILFGGLPKKNPMVSYDANIIHYGEIEIIGSFSYHPKFHEQALDFINCGIIPPEKLITQTYTLNDINTAFDTALNGCGLKIVVEP